MKPSRAFFLCLAACVMLAAPRVVPAGPVTADKNDTSGEVVLANDLLRVRFLAPGPHQFHLFPKGYTGYTVEVKAGQAWKAMASAPYFTSFCYRSGWGRDWVAYVIPQTVRIERDGDAARVIFTEIRWDADRVRWDFTFTFVLKPDRPIVDVTYAAVPTAKRELLQMWGPRLQAGEGNFGAAKDEALFPGLEYLGPQDRSSKNSAIAPDAQFHFVPTPTKITIPLMTIVREKYMVGLMWDPLQKWLGDETCPAALFASPNWIQSEANHLMGLFVPSTPRYVAENSMRAHTPANVEAGQCVSISAQIFAAPAAHAIDAIDLYLKQRGGLPARPPLPAADTLETLVRALTTTAYNEKVKGWAWDWNGDAAAGPWRNLTMQLQECASLVKDGELGKRAAGIAREVLAQHPERPLSLALRLGGLASALNSEQIQAQARMKTQNPDGSWSYVPTETAEAGLAMLNAPPHPGEIAPPAFKSQGITAGELAPLMDYVLISDDGPAWQAALKGLADLDRFEIPLPYRQPECPPSPSLHGSYYALRCFLDAYRITGEKRYLERAVYWARTGLPFIYLWSLPPRNVTSGQIQCAEKMNPLGESLYADTRRDVMLYGGLYGYGSSQFSHHWFGLLVQWIPLVYASDIAVLAEYDQTLPWKKLAEGIVASAAAQVYDKSPYTGHLPDAFSLDTWTPSGPAFSPAMLLDSVLRLHFGRSSGPQTAIARDGDTRCHVTSTVLPTGAALKGHILTFSLHDPLWSHVRVIVTGAGNDPEVLLDGKTLERADDLESKQECWARSPAGLTLLKIRRNSTARRVEIRF